MNELISVQNEFFTATPLGLRVTGDPTFDQWVEYGRVLKFNNDSIHFIIGDWLNYGETKYGETYKKAIEITGFNYQTVRDDKWVAGRIPLEERHKNLSYSHHKAVASLDEEEREEILTKAETENLNSTKMQELMKPMKKQPQLSLIRDNSKPVEQEQLVAQVADITKVIKDNIAVLSANLQEGISSDLPAPVAQGIIKEFEALRSSMAGFEIKYGIE